MRANIFGEAGGGREILRSPAIRRIHNPLFFAYFLFPRKERCFRFGIDSDLTTRMSSALYSPDFLGSLRSEPIVSHSDIYATCNTSDRCIGDLPVGMDW